MADTNTYSYSTLSWTHNSATVTSSTGSSSSSTDSATIAYTSSPDGSDGMAASLGGTAAAGATDTLTTGSLSGTLADGGSATTAGLSASMLAAGQSPSGTAFALAATSAGVEGGPEVVVGATVNSANSTQGPTGSSAVATSTTNLAAVDIHAPTTGEDGGVGAAHDAFTPTSYAQANLDLDLDGNIALIQFDAIAIGDNTVVEVNATVLAAEGELSLSDAAIELAVD
jgi:hypothetical protein